jgi:hypothetical protein
MAKFFKQVAGTPEESLLGIDCKHALTTCTCFLTQNAHNCTITRPTCTLGNPEYQRQLQQQETNTLSTTREQDCSEKPFLCICGEPFPTAFALNLHIVGAPTGRGHDWTPASRPRLGFNIIIFDPNHPNPFKGMVMAFSERVPSHNIHHEHSTSIEEQAVAAALNALNRIGSHNSEYIISRDSLACLSRGQAARRLARTKEAHVLIPCQRIIDQLNLRMCDVSLHHEQSYHEREKRKTRDTAMALLARLNHANDMLAGQVTKTTSTHELNLCGSSIPDLKAPPHFYRQGSPLYGDTFQQIGTNTYLLQMDHTLRTIKNNHHLCLRLTSLSKTGEVNITLTSKAWETLHPNLQAEMIRDCIGLISSSTFELSHAVGCTNGEKIRRMTRYMEKGEKTVQHNDHRACPFCHIGQDSRHHWRFECPRTEGWERMFPSTSSKRAELIFSGVPIV